MEVARGIGRKCTQQGPHVICPICSLGPISQQSKLVKSEASIPCCVTKCDVPLMTQSTNSGQHAAAVQNWDRWWGFVQHAAAAIYPRCIALCKGELSCGCNCGLASWCRLSDDCVHAHAMVQIVTSSMTMPPTLVKPWNCGTGRLVYFRTQTSELELLELQAPVRVLLGPWGGVPIAIVTNQPKKIKSMAS